MVVVVVVVVVGAVVVVVGVVVVVVVVVVVGAMVVVVVIGTVVVVVGTVVVVVVVVVVRAKVVVVYPKVVVVVKPKVVVVKPKVVVVKPKVVVVVKRNWAIAGPAASRIINDKINVLLRIFYAYPVYPCVHLVIFHALVYYKEIKTRTTSTPWINFSTGSAYISKFQFKVASILLNDPHSLIII